MSETGKGLARAYRSAGRDFLAYRLGKLFTRIETPEDTALHNDILAEVLLIVSGSEQSFLRNLAGIVLYQQDKRKRFLFRVANQVLNIAQKKG